MLLDLCDLLNMLSCGTQGHQPRGGTSHNGTGPSPSMKKMPSGLPIAYTY